MSTIEEVHAKAVLRLASEVDDSLGWLSDAQDAQLWWDESSQTISFCG